MNSLNSFNWLAGSYDLLVKMVFGGSLDKAQVVYLKDIPQGANVLILGGGTGYILMMLLKINPSCKVWYIEASTAMIKRAKKRASVIPEGVEVYFIHGTENSIPGQIKFDIVITNFFLDLFSPSTLESVIQKIKLSLVRHGKWFVCDFVTQNKFWQTVLLNLMYFFFKHTCSIESTKLPPWELKLKNAGLREMKSKMFLRSFVKSTVYLRGGVNE